MRSITFGNRPGEVRKEKGWSQGDLAEQISASKEIIGTCEPNENSPSIEMALKMAKAFGVTVDCEYSSYDQDTIDRIKSIQKMDTNTKSVLFNVIDAYIQNFKTKQAFATK